MDSFPVETGRSDRAQEMTVIFTVDTFLLPWQLSIIVYYYTVLLFSQCGMQYTNLI